MSDASFIQFRRLVHLNYLRTLPGALDRGACGPYVADTMLRQRRDSREFDFFVATVAIAIGFTITFVFNVPVNDQLETEMPAPANARKVWVPLVAGKRRTSVRTIFGCWGLSLK